MLTCDVSLITKLYDMYINHFFGKYYQFTGLANLFQDVTDVTTGNFYWYFGIKGIY